MHHFHYVGGKLFCEKLSVESLAKKFGTPLYIHSQRTLVDHFQRLDPALAPLDHMICYAMKANSNLAVMRALAQLRQRFRHRQRRRIATRHRGGRRSEEMRFRRRWKNRTGNRIRAAHKEFIPSTSRANRNCSASIKVAARMKKIAPIAVRVNPNVDAGTHANITTGTYENKFGIAFEQVEGVYARASKLKNLRLRGIQMHIGSQLTKSRRLKWP